MVLRTLAVLGVVLVAGAAAWTASGREPSDPEMRSYALGMLQARMLRQYEIEVDPEAYASGLKDVLTGKTTRLSDRQADEVRAAVKEEVRARLAAVRERTLKERAAENKAAGEAFLAANKAKAGIVALKNGLQYKILKSGDGETPGLADSVAVNYRGSLIDGKVFATNAGRGQPAIYAVKKVMPGWREALLRMPVGSKWEIYIPSDLAYGERPASRRVGPNATLVFQVELLSIVTPENVESAASSPADKGNR